MAAQTGEPTTSRTCLNFNVLHGMIRSDKIFWLKMIFEGCSSRRALEHIMHQENLLTSDCGC